MICLLSVTTTATLRLHQISYVYMTITFSMKFMAGHECDFPISWEFEMFPLNYYSGSQNQECKKFYIAKARVPSQYEKNNNK